jgi:hypothetical protein
MWRRNSEQVMNLATVCAASNVSLIPFSKVVDLTALLKQIQRIDSQSNRLAPRFHTLASMQRSGIEEFRQ